MELENQIFLLVLYHATQIASRLKSTKSQMKFSIYINVDLSV